VINDKKALFLNSALVIMVRVSEDDDVKVREDEDEG
jgi:hypothetical protein